MTNIVNRSGSSTVWVPPRSSELAMVVRREKLVRVSLLLGFVALFVVLGLDVQYMVEKLPLLVATIPLVLVISFWVPILSALWKRHRQSG